MSDRVGFIGLGVMGRPMAANLIDAGHDVIVHTRDQAVLAATGELGATVARDRSQVAARADIVITMLPDAAAVTAVIAGAGGVLEALRPGSLLVEMSTIEPRVASDLAALARERGAAMLDAPVSGGDVGAREGTLSIMVGGDAADVERARPIFEVLGSKVTHVGPSGAGQVVKACNQVVVGITYAAVSEALVLGARAGIDPAQVLDVLGGGLAANRVMEVRRRNLLEHDFTPGFKIDLHHKDLGIALETGAELNVPLPFTAEVRELMTELRADGHGELDHSALLMVAERRAAFRIG